MICPLFGAPFLFLRAPCLLVSPEKSVHWRSVLKHISNGKLPALFFILLHVAVLFPFLQLLCIEFRLKISFLRYLTKVKETRLTACCPYLGYCTALCFDVVINRWWWNYVFGLCIVLTACCPISVIVDVLVDALIQSRVLLTAPMLVLIVCIFQFVLFRLVSF